MKNEFQFIDPGRLTDNDLELVLTKQIPADPVAKRVPYYEFEMRQPGSLTAMGSIRLRIGPEDILYYAGNIGYEVKEEYRGKHYAARSSLLILPLARAYGLEAAWLTVNPHNTPSLKTCKIIGARYIETVRLPKSHEMYGKSDYYRRRFRRDLNR